MHAQATVAGALARQWMGVVLRPRGLGDDWIARGLAAWLLDFHLRKSFGLNEVLYRWGQNSDGLCVDPPGCCVWVATGVWKIDVLHGRKQASKGAQM